MLISAVILTKNEERNIEECLKTLKWCEEIILIDDNSIDKTVSLAQKLGAKVFARSLNNDFSAQRNFGLDKANGRWILFVDADERVSAALRAEIKKQILNDQYVGFYLKRQDKLWGKTLRHGENGKVQLLRLGRKSGGRWIRPVHEVWQVEGRIGELRSPLIHYPHQTISEFLGEINFYSTIRAHELYDQKRKTNLLEILTYPIVKFFKNYFFNLGILDGMSGFLLALVMSFYSFLVRTKLYLLWKQ